MGISDKVGVFDLNKTKKKDALSIVKRRRMLQRGEASIQDLVILLGIRSWIYQCGLLLKWNSSEMDFAQHALVDVSQLW